MKNMKFDYDLEEDSLFLYLDEEGYDFSEFLTDSIAIDFNTEKVPIGIEIFNASRKFATQKTNLMNIIKGMANVSIDMEKIKFSINLNIQIHNKLNSIKPLSIVIDNDFDIPASETSMLIP